MPDFDGTGPVGAGAMSGWGRGPSDAWRGVGLGHGRFRGSEAAWGCRPRQGWRGCNGLGWMALGWSAGGAEAARAGIHAALERRLSILKAEMTRTEALLAEGKEDGPTA